MKKIFLVLFLLTLACPLVFADYFSKHKNLYSKNPKEMEQILTKRLYKIADNPDNVYELKILNKKYTCYNNNCYDFSSFRYSRLAKTIHINMIIDLMNWNEHQEYNSPYNNGYVSHLIFETKLHKDKLFVKCKGFVVGDVVVNYENGKASSAHYDIIAVYGKKPITIKNISEFEKTFCRWIDINSFIQLLKHW